MLRNAGQSFLMPLLAAALAVAAPVAVALARSGGAGDAMLYAAIGFGLSYTALAGVYLVLGRPGFWLRLPVALLLAVAGGAVSALADRVRVSVWCGASLFIALLIATPIFYLWGRGLRLIHPDDPAPLPSTQRRQFSLLGALWATTSIAILLGVARYLEFPIDELGAVGAIFAATACIAWTGAAALLSRIPTAVAIAALAAAMVPAALVLPGFSPRATSTGGLQLSPAFDVVIPLVVVVAIALLTVRAAGYYLRWPIYEPPPPIAAPAPPTLRLVSEDQADADQSNHSSDGSNLG